MSLPPSLDEQQQRFMRAKLLMATGLVPPQAPPRKPLVQTDVPTRKDSTSPVPTTAKDAKRSRRRSTTKSQHAKAKFSTQPRSVEATQPPRKSAHAIQKEQRQALVDEVRELEAHVEQLRRRTGLPTKTDHEELTQAKTLTGKLDEMLHANRRYALQLRSEVKKELHLPPVNTLATHIHLPRNMEQRRTILLALKHVKIRRAAQVGLAQFEHLDPLTPYLSHETFLTDDNVFHYHRREQSTFSNFKTARQAFDAMFFFIYNTEISVTEMGNQVAVREDDQDFEPTIWNHRVVTTTEDIGCLEELNMVGFAYFFERYEPLDGAPLGVIFVETVEEDDLYPYVPEDRVRKRFQLLFLACEVVDPVTNQKSVVKKSCLLGAQLPPEFPLDPALLAKLHKYTTRWMDILNQYLHDYAVPV